jgi:hypothetical protein
LWWFTLERDLCCSFYIIKEKGNSKEFHGIPLVLIWIDIMLRGEKGNKIKDLSMVQMKIIGGFG